jgi:glycine/D-amino acid oxidase-like deaminating enzyme
MIENEQPVIANSLWSATANPIVHCPELQSDVSADVAIVGAGFTGLSAALHLAQMGQSVAVLEAQTPGWGASGRNGGQVNPGLIEAPNDAIARFGSEMGQRMIRLSGQAGRLVFDLIVQHQIQCDARPVGWLRAAHNPRGLRSLEQKAEQWAQHGVDLQLLSHPDVVQALGTNAYIGGLIDPRGGNLHPLNYALGLCDAARAAGVWIYGQSKVEKLERRGPEHLLVTKRGQLRAGRVLLCTNGYSGPLHRGLQRSVVPIRSVQVATEPLSAELRSHILPALHAPSDTRRLLSYFRMDAAGRFVMGARGGYSVQATRTRLAQARAWSIKLFPQLAQVRWEFEWGGYIAATADHYPHLHDFGNGMAAGLGYNGRGVAMATAMGKVLADWALGTPHADLDFPMTPLRKIPFHPFYPLGVEARATYYKLLDRLGL